MRRPGRRRFGRSAGPARRNVFRAGLRFELLEDRRLLSTGEIRGALWFDLDADGQRGESETGWPGVTIYLDANANGHLDANELWVRTAEDDASTPGDESGGYVFTDLAAGDYLVAQVLPPAWWQTSPRPASDVIQRVSLTASGTQPGGDVESPSISADGRYVAFHTAAWMQPGDDTLDDVFLYDRELDQLTRISAGASGYKYRNPSLSADGRYVAFESQAGTGFSQIYVLDRETATTQLISHNISLPSQGGNRSSRFPQISDDGRYVAFQSDATNLVFGDTNNWGDIFWYDRLATGTKMRRVSISTTGAQSTGNTAFPAISGDGQFVGFIGPASNLVPGDTNGRSDTFLRHVPGNTTERVSITSDETQGIGGESGYGPRISGDGRFVTFASSMPLTADDANGTYDVFVRDRSLGTTERITTRFDDDQLLGIWTADISNDGRYVALAFTRNTNDPERAANDVFLFDRHSGVWETVSLNAEGAAADAASVPVSIDSDGSDVAFASLASNLVPGDTNGYYDVYTVSVEQRRRGSTHAVTLIGGDVVDQQDFGATNSPPGVAAIARADADPSRSESVAFSVSFDEPVTGVDSDDFQLATSGVIGAAITDVSGADTDWTVTVQTGSGDGTLRLDLVDNNSILDASGQPLGGIVDGSLAGETYAIDKSPPTLVGVSPLNAAVDVVWDSDLSFALSEPVQKGQGKVTIRRTSDQAIVEIHDVSSPQVSVASGVVTIARNARLPGDVEYGIQVDAGALADPAGNAFAGILDPDTWRFTSLSDPPTVTSTTPAESNPTRALTVEFQVAFSEPVTGVDADDFAITADGLKGFRVLSVAGDGAFRTVTVATGSGQGTLRLDLVDDNSILDSDGVPLGGFAAGDGSFFGGSAYSIERPDAYVTITGSGAVAEGSQLTVNLDSAGILGILSWTLDWGDGTVEIISGDPATASHVYADGLAAHAVSGSASDGVQSYTAIVQLSEADDLDQSFANGGKFTMGFAEGNGYDRAQDMLVQPDGKIVVAGFGTQTGTGFGLARLDPDGTLDASFGSDGLVTTVLGASSGAYGAVLQPDGKIVAVGYTVAVTNEPADVAVVRYNADGSLDSGFGTGGVMILDIAGGDDRLRDVALLPDGTILAAGQAGLASPTFLVMRLTPEGVLDSTFGDGGYRTTDHAGTSSDYAYSLATFPDGSFVVGGMGWGRSGTEWDSLIARYTSEGDLDPSFADDGFQRLNLSPSSYAEDRLTALTVDGQNRIVAVGWYPLETSIGTTGYVHENALAVRLNLDGSVDGVAYLDFGYRSSERAEAVAVLPDGAIMVGGYRSESGVTSWREFVLVRLNPDLTRDTTFGNNGRLDIDFFQGVDEFDEIYALAVRPGGGVIAAGSTYLSEVGYDFAVAAVGSSTVTVTEVPPTLSVTGPAAIEAGDTYTLSFGATDPGEDMLVSWQVDWGDGTVDTLPDAAADATHRYLVEGIYAIAVTAADEDGETEAVGPVVTVSGTVPGGIRGTLWHDRDEDSRREPGEPPLATWTVFLDADRDGQFDDGERWAGTDAEGNYEFTGLAPGEYVVSEILPQGWAQTLPGPLGLERIVTDGWDGLRAVVAAANPAISTDGRFVAFESALVDLVPGDTNARRDIFVFDRQTATVSRVSVDSLGTQANGDSFEPSISGDGRFVTFRSRASNLAAPDLDATDDIFLHDRETGQTRCISIDFLGGEADAISYEPNISEDGRFVAFWSQATDLVPNDTNGWRDTFVHELATGVTQRISVDSAGTQATGGHSYGGALSADGRFVAFQSFATNLTATDGNQHSDIFVRDRLEGTTERVSVTDAGNAANGPSTNRWISGDGRFVVFESLASNLVAGDSNNVADVFVRDRQAGQTRRISVSTDGVQADRPSQWPQISTDGRYVTFQSNATNLEGSDVATYQNVFLHDLVSGSTRKLSRSLDASPGAGNSVAPSLSGDGRFVVFASAAKGLLHLDPVQRGGLFVADSRLPDGASPRNVRVAADQVTVVDGFGNVDLSAPEVLGVSADATGVRLKFSRQLATDQLNLYDDSSGSPGPADAALVGEALGQVRGSLIFGDGGWQAAFVRSGGPLPPDTYTLVLRSAGDAFGDTSGELDGDGDGQPGGDYRWTFTIDPAPADDIILSVPDFARGGSQSVDLPTSSHAGIPLTLSSGQNISQVQFALVYDPALLTITGFETSVPGAEASHQVLAPGRVHFAVSSASEFASSGGAIEVGRILAEVPTSADYGAMHVLDLGDLAVYDGSAGSPQLRASRADDGVHVVAFLGDTDASGGYSGADVTLLQRVIVGSASGFAAHPLADPLLLADLNANGAVAGSDTTLLQRAVVGIAVPTIPAIPLSPPPAPLASSKPPATEEPLGPSASQNVFAVADAPVSFSASRSTSGLNSELLPPINGLAVPADGEPNFAPTVPLAVARPVPALASVPRGAAPLAPAELLAADPLERQPHATQTNVRYWQRPSQPSTRHAAAPAGNRLLAADNCALLEDILGDLAVPLDNIAEDVRRAISGKDR